MRAVSKDSPHCLPFPLEKARAEELLGESVRLVLEDVLYFSILRRIGEVVGTVTDLREACMRLAQIMLEEFPVTRVALLMETTGDELETMVSLQRWNEDPPKQGFWPQVGQVLPRGEEDSPFLRAWGASGSWVESLPPKENGSALRFVGVPFSIRARKRGILCLESSSHKPVESRDFSFWSLLSNQVSLVLEAVSLLEEQRHWNRLLEERVKERTRELEEANEELVCTRDQLIRSEKLKALGQMASGIAHDFNNVLATILGFAQLYAPQARNGDIRRCLEIIEQAARDGANTVRRIQEFGGVKRSFSGRERLQINRLLREIREMIRPRWRDQLQKQGRTVSFHLDLGRVKPIEGDAAELRDVFTNIIFNALDAMPTGGEIRVTTGTVGSKVQVNVEDTGEGINQKDLQLIFDPFFTTKGPSHSGLGLCTSYGIIQRHGGDIRVNSTPGKGTKVSVLLPSAESKPDPRPKRSSPRQDAGRADAAEKSEARVLVIEDEAPVRTILADILQRQGYEVLTAAAGSEGLEVFEGSRFDLVITDLGMPGMSGWEVAKTLKKKAPDVPIVLVTGWGDEISSEQWREQGIAQLLTKPFNVETVRRVVAHHLRDRKAAESPTNSPSY